MRAMGFYLSFCVLGTERGEREKFDQFGLASPIRLF